MVAQVIGASKLDSSSSDSSKKDTLFLGLFWMLCIACVVSQLSVSISVNWSCAVRIGIRFQTLYGCTVQTLFGVCRSVHGVPAEEAGVLYRFPEHAALLLGCPLLPTGCAPKLRWISVIPISVLVFSACVSVCVYLRACCVLPTSATTLKG